MKIQTFAAESDELIKAIKRATSDAENLLSMIGARRLFSIQAQTTIYYEELDHDASVQMFAHIITVVYE